MKRKSEQDIMAAVQPEDIFSMMNPELLEQEKEEYIQRFKPTEYRTIQNFVVTRKVLLLYEQAMNQINDGWNEKDVYLKSITGREYKIHYTEGSSFKLGKRYVTSKYVIYVIEKEYKKYYQNYITKTKRYLKPDKTIWNFVEYMLPKVKENFETTEGEFVILVEKPAEMYSLRDILEYFDGNLRAEYVASILTRLYYFACYMSLTESTHNAITLDNLFFKPGREIEEGANFTIDDMRIVGVYGGWFFTTYFNEKLKGVPREVYEIMPDNVKRRGYSSFEVDELSIKRLAKALLGNQENVPKPLLEWIQTTKIAKDPYSEFRNWEDVIIASFGARRFVDMNVDVSK